MYKYTDATIKYLERQYVEMFANLKSLTSMDELNVMQSVRTLYTELDALNRKMYRQLAKIVYESTRETELAELDTQWVDEVLDAYDKTTKYVYSHEVERKAARLMEAILATGVGKNKEIDSALRAWSLMGREYAIRITDESTSRAFADDGIEYAMWITERDNRVCDICAERDKKIFPLANFPAKPHIGCRCKRRRVRPK